MPKIFLIGEIFSRNIGVKLGKEDSNPKNDKLNRKKRSNNVYVIILKIKGEIKIMKKIKYLAIALTVLFMLVSLTACGGGDAAPANNAVKDDLKDYINNHAVTNFVPLNEEIVIHYTEAVQTGDGDVLATVLKENLIRNALLFEELEAYTPETTEVQELHNIFFKAVEIRELAYVDILLVLTDLDAEEEDINAAFDMLDESDNLFIEFSTKMDAMRKDLGL
ncbi:hypothetical protein SAMN05660297_03636 [Natronincola peptidivorans]|uniref:Uncharacterized protein n=1 Tax=Natronincola peptidivorans TaxID=426128 RepID=A0A1I0HGM3_9FIRM|nr:hypothetical protein [Natronincola peptidivorans]SET83056.1 hypothetical protein SAMN05660297_03636 [Natronincola peptidivorans]